MSFFSSWSASRSSRLLDLTEISSACRKFFNRSFFYIYSFLLFGVFSGRLSQAFLIYHKQAMQPNQRIQIMIRLYCLFILMSPKDLKLVICSTDQTHSHLRTPQCVRRPDWLFTTMTLSVGRSHGNTPPLAQRGQI